MTEAASPTARAIAAAVLAGADAGAPALAAAAACTANPFNAVRHVDEAAVRRQVEDLARRLGAGERPPLAGVPIAIKDNLCDAGQPCGCASKILEGYVAPYTATAVARLRAAGAIVVARTNMDEFAMGSSTEHSAYGPARNPWDEARTPGGSSGGSAALVAAGVVPIALGSETGGSVRQPAALCGVVGLKPTYGAVSRHGLVAFASSLDVVSPFGADVADAALAMSVIAGPDAADSTGSDRPEEDLAAAASRPVTGLRVGVLDACDAPGVEDGVRASVGVALDALREAGAVLQPVRIASLDLALACYAILAPAEASSNLARFDGIRYGPRAQADDLLGTYVHTRAGGFGPEVQRRILLGTFVLSAGYVDAYYESALRVRAAIAADLEAALRDVDVLVSPTSPTVAFPLGARDRDPLAMYLADVFTVPASLAGLPAISVPGPCSGGLPVGVQITGRRGQEGTVLAAAAAVERGVGRR